ncbi:GDSL-type esterase/lipase family protein [Parasediminibacterium sp. JCM 36343]|uniref:GDSL-type esterase/lipase family protein n=1 Tax=Parasediminibacterium sp. JCM 36343 TaxID=3374279 RepID=UPI00397D6498
MQPYFYTICLAIAYMAFRNTYQATFAVLLNRESDMFWYEQDVKGVEAKKAKVVNPKMLFYGSSSIRLWSSLEKDFAEYKPLNMGFGGSTMAACIVYFERLMAGLNPDIILIYAGDNDLGDGRHPEEVLIFFKQLIAEIRGRFGKIPVLFVSIKPSITRFNIINQIRFTNSIIKDAIAKMDGEVFYIDIFDKMLDANNYPDKSLFLSEGLHINEKGYAIWKKMITGFMTEHNIHLQ